MNKSKIQKLIREYVELKPLYKEFSKAMKSILETILRNNQFKYQTVSCREKEVYSLERKLKTDKNLQKLRLRTVREIDDLAGCRIVFYTNDDIQRFINYVHKEFKVVKQNLRYSDDDYNALHIIVGLSRHRLRLGEYARFRSLKCEIQLTTVLFHAWAEMAHGVTYKPEEELVEFDERTLDSLKEYFSKVMREHLKQAQYTFDFIAKQVENLRQGKQVFDIEFLKSIVASKSNSELFQKLNSF